MGTGTFALRHRGLAANRLAMWGWQGVLLLCLLADAFGKEEQPEKGLKMLSEGLAMPETKQGGLYAAEFYRVKGELLLKQAGGISRDAESCFRQAVEIARARREKSLELRAVTSLSRLLLCQGKREEARRLLAEIYAWFTEGFETRDLREAKALLEEL